ncbi:MAG: type II toxin-antitoxin system VapC family toxin [Candidatus Methanomethylicaceae archaeon]
MVYLDTDVFIGLLKGDSKAITLINKLQSMSNSLKTTIITAYELLKGAAISSKPQENLKIVRDLFSNVNILPLKCGSCKEAAEIYSSLKNKGKQ